MELFVGVPEQIVDLSSNIEPSAGYERAYDIVTQFEQRRYIERSFKKEGKKEGSNVKRKEETGAATIIHVGASSNQGHSYRARAL